MSKLSLAHACIHTASLEETSAFYCDALGLERRFDFMRGGKPAGFYLEAANGTFIEVFSRRGWKSPIDVP